MFCDGLFVLSSSLYVWAYATEDIGLVGRVERYVEVGNVGSDRGCGPLYSGAVGVAGFAYRGPTAQPLRTSRTTARPQTSDLRFRSADAEVRGPKFEMRTLTAKLR